jgi:hypothetical protein
MRVMPAELPLQCTLRERHAGLHVATGPGHRLLAVWLEDKILWRLGDRVTTWQGEDREPPDGGSVEITPGRSWDYVWYRRQPGAPMVGLAVLFLSLMAIMVMIAAHLWRHGQWLALICSVISAGLWALLGHAELVEPAFEPEGRPSDALARRRQPRNDRPDML